MGDAPVSRDEWLTIAIIVLVVTALFLFGCGPRPLCVTRCGIELQRPAPASWSCAELQRAEDLSLEAYQFVLDPRFDYACPLARGWKLKVNPAPWWIDITNGAVMGLTDCDKGTLEVGSVPPLRSSFTHELAHVVQRCEPRGTPSDGGQDDYGHSDWTADGIRAAIIEVYAVGLSECDGGCR